MKKVMKATVIGLGIFMMGMYSYERGVKDTKEIYEKVLSNRNEELNQLFKEVLDEKNEKIRALKAEIYRMSEA
ncbi:MAG: hypothetical protein K0R00_52 [Herbinix sp.]|jgi:hypothetical protein|nr:hypothetical protein [Herbinix sp.]